MEKQKKTTYEVLRGIRRSLLTRVGAGLSYPSWQGNNNQIVNHILDVHETIRRWREEYDFDIQPAELTESEMKDLEFGKWTESSPDYLLPIWVYPFLPEELLVSSIDTNCKEQRIVKKSEIDTDQRMGYLAYGIRPADYVPSTPQIQCAY
jgi:hypothetical protein